MMKTYSVAGNNNKFIQLGLDYRLGSVGMPRDEILHVCVSEGTSDGQDAIDSVI